MKNISTKSIILISFFFALLAFAGAFLVSKNKSKEVINEATSTPIAEVREEIKDGVYTNYTYGFSFEYPESIFNNMSPWESSSKKFFLVDGQRTPVLVVGITNTSTNSDYYMQFYQACISANQGDVLRKTAKSGSSVKRYTLGDICVTESNPDGLIDGEASWGYGATIPYKSDSHIYIVISELDPNKLELLKDDFDAIIKSFKFLDN